MFHIVCTFVLAAAPLWAAQSLRIPNATFTRTAPNAPPYNAVTNFRLEGRIHNWTRSNAWTGIWGAAGWTNLRFMAGEDKISFQSNADGSREVRLPIAGRTDFTFRAQRNTATGKLSLEIWDVDGTNYVFGLSDTTSTSPINLSGDHSFGGPTTDCSLAYFRWYSTTVALNSAPPNNAAGGDVGHWEFEGNGADSSPRTLNFNISGTFQPTPTYPPAVYVGDLQRTVRAGSRFTLDAGASFSLGPNAHLSYFWNQVSGPSTLVFSSHDTSAVDLSGAIFGTYTIRLVLTDGSGSSTTKDLKVGAVATDANGVVIVPDPKWNFLLGPLTIWGSSPWPWFDQTEKAVAEAIGRAMPLASPGNTPLPGTITVTRGSTTITGNGTSFQSTFNCNGTDLIMVHYPLAGGGTGRRPYTVVSCQSQNSMTIDQWGAGTAFDDPGAACASGCSGVAYARVTDNSTEPAAVTLDGWYPAASTNWNYYDCVLAYYKLYYRTGLDTYLNYARQLADNWWKYPLDEGRSSTNGSYGSPPRGGSLLGMMARALDGRPEMWPGIAAIMESYHIGFVVSAMHPAYPPSHTMFNRETGYQLLFDAYAAYLHPDAAARSAFLSRAQSSVDNYWVPRLHSQSGITGKWWKWSEDGLGWEGAGPFPFHQVYAIHGMLKLSELNGNASTFNVAKDVTDFTLTSAYTESNRTIPSAGPCRGIYYSLFLTRCAGGSQCSTCAHGNCELLGSCPNPPAGQTGSRTVSNAVPFLAGYLYQKTGDASYKTKGDDLFSANYGANGGGPGADGGYGNFNDAIFYNPTSVKGKEYGFTAGSGYAHAYLAYRLGGLQPAVTRSVQIGFDISMIPNGAQVRITLVRPSGEAVQTTCSVSPCTVTADVRQGDHLMKLEYLSADGAVLAAGEATPLSIP